jgi:hypothetical protein
VDGLDQVKFAPGSQYVATVRSALAYDPLAPFEVLPTDHEYYSDRPPMRGADPEFLEGRVQGNLGLVALS